MGVSFVIGGHSGVNVEAPELSMANFSEIIDKLVKKRAELHAELTKLDDAISTLSSMSDIFSEKDLDSVTTNYSDTVRSESGKALPQKQDRRERGILPPEEIARLAREILIANGRPLKRGALVRAMESRSIPMTGRDKAKNLGTILWRYNKDFINLDGYGYWPRDIPFNQIYNPRRPPDGIVSPCLKNRA